MINKKDYVVFVLILTIQLLAIFFISQGISSLANQLAQKKYQLTTFEQKEASLVKISEDYSSITEDMAIMNEALPDKQKIVGFINSLEKQASESGILTKITFGREAVVSESRDLKSLRFSLSFKGTYSKMIEFIQKIEKFPQVVVVEKINIQSPKGLDGENNIILDLKCYLDSKF